MKAMAHVWRRWLTCNSIVSGINNPVYAVAPEVHYILYWFWNMTRMLFSMSPNPERVTWLDTSMMRGRVLILILFTTWLDYHCFATCFLVPGSGWSPLCTLLFREEQSCCCYFVHIFRSLQFFEKQSFTSSSHFCTCTNSFVTVFCK